MNPFLFAVYLSAGPVRAAQASEDWVRPASVRAVGIERFPGEGEFPLSIEASKGMLGFTTQRGLGDSLFGIRRREVSGPRGIYTWLPSWPGWCLELPGISTDYYGSLLTPNRYPRSVVSGPLYEFQQALGKRIQPRPAEQVGGRDCLVFTIIDRSLASTQQWLWIDRETGITLKRTDIAGRNEDYAYTFSRFMTGPALPATDFGPPTGFRVIRGVVNPEILQHVNEAHTAADYATALQKAAAELKNSDGAWLHKVEIPKDCAYVQTVVRERKVVRPRRPLIGGQTGGPEVLPGGLPPGWNVSGQISEDGKAIGLSFLTPQGQGPRAIIGMPQGAGFSSSFTMTIGEENKPSLSLSYVTYLASDGTLVIAPGTSASEAEERRQRLREEEGGGSTLVQSDFLDRATGDTVSYIQSRGRRPGLLLSGFVLTEPQERRSEKLGTIRVQTCQKPYALTVLSWKTAGADQTLVSTRMTVEQLLTLAESVTPVK